MENKKENRKKIEKRTAQEAGFGTNKLAPTRPSHPCNGAWARRAVAVRAFCSWMPHSLPQGPASQSLPLFLGAADSRFSVCGPLLSALSSPPEFTRGGNRNGEILAGAYQPTLRGDKPVALIFPTPSAPLNLL